MANRAVQGSITQYSVQGYKDTCKQEASQRPGEKGLILTAATRRTSRVCEKILQ